MNRNQMYNYLKEIGLKPLIHHRGRKYRQPVYHTEFVEDFNTSLKIDSIITDWGYITGFNRINLYAKEISLESDLELGQININYENIKKFEVIMYDEDEIEAIP